MMADHGSHFSPDLAVCSTAPPANADVHSLQLLPILSPLLPLLLLQLPSRLHEPSTAAAAAVAASSPSLLVPVVAAAVP